MFGFIKDALFKLVPEYKKWELKRKYLIPSMEWSMVNLKKNGFSPSTIIDIGAYEGQWTPTTEKIFPQARVLVVEAQAGQRHFCDCLRFLRLCPVLVHSLPDKALGQPDIFFTSKNYTL